MGMRVAGTYHAGPLLARRWRGKRRIDPKVVRIERQVQVATTQLTLMEAAQ
jgi:hypothetical protein